MELLIWSLIFIVSVCALIKAADWLVLGLQKAAHILGSRTIQTGLPVALIGVAMPELAASIAAVLQGQPELAVALVVGSSIANILLVTGISALIGGPLALKKEYLELDLPLFAASVAAFCFIAADGSINRFEGAVMILMFIVYSCYVFSSRPRRDITARDIITPELLGGPAMARIVEMLPTRLEKKLEAATGAVKHPWWKAATFLFGGAALLVVAANFTIESLAGISEFIGEFISTPGVITVMIVLAISTALPELFGSLEAVRTKRDGLTIGNLFAATTVNLLLVCGVASQFTTLVFGGVVLAVGLPFLAAAALLLAVSVIPGKINSGEGALFLFLYFLFFVKLLGLF